MTISQDPLPLENQCKKLKELLRLMVTFLSNIIHNNIGKYLQTMILLKLIW